MALKPALEILKLTQSEILLRLNEDEKAESVARELLSNTSLNLPALRVVLKALERQKKFSEAQMVLKKFSGLDRAESLSLQADLLAAQGEVKKAIHILQEVGQSRQVRFKISKMKAEASLDLGGFQNHGLSFQNWLVLAEKLVRQKSFTNAPPCYKKSLELQSGNASVLNNLAWCLYKSGEDEKA